MKMEVKKRNIISIRAICYNIIRQKMISDEKINRKEIKLFHSIRLLIFLSFKFKKFYFFFMYYE